MNKAQLNPTVLLHSGLSEESHLAELVFA
uniref:Uncharacterized protein n=1 Tax=Anguilla anguilla TaxID=7936 RepID=A0A0E9XIT7_ANGAN